MSIATMVMRRVIRFLVNLDTSLKGEKPMRDTDIRAFLSELYETGKQNDGQEQELSKKMLNLEPVTAQFLNILIRSSRRTRLLEIGTSNGYSTIWLAWAASVKGGRVISVDRGAGKQALADANLRQGGVGGVVGVKCGGG